MDARPGQTAGGPNVRGLFFRGLKILLPTVLTIWILVAAYGFVRNKFAAPINAGVRELIVRVVDFPRVSEADVEMAKADMTAAERASWESSDPSGQRLREAVQRTKMQQWWERYRIGLDLIGLVIAVALICAVGLALSSIIGKQVYARGEVLLQKMPLIKHVYPSVKQVTDFLVGSDSQKMRFSKVVAVEYPRKGVWSLGLLTGESLRSIGEHARRPCATVFVPSSPTPFTGYVVTVPVEDMIEMPMSIEDALRFIVSGGVIVSADQRWPGGGQGAGPRALPAEPHGGADARTSSA